MVSLALVPFPSVGHTHRRPVSVMSHGPSIYHLHRQRCGPHEMVLEKLIVQLCLIKVFVAAKSYFFSTGLHDSFSDVAIILWQSLNPQLKIVSEYDQEIRQSQTTDNPVAPLGRAAQPS